MNVYKGYRHRIYPTPDQAEAIEKTFSCCRYVWNALLYRTQMMYERRRESASKFDMMKMVTDMKRYRPWLDEVGAHALRYSVIGLYEARQAFFRRVKAGGQKAGYPRYKSKKHPVQSFTTDGAIKDENGYVQVPRIGRLRYKRGRQSEGRPREVTISRDALGRYWASVLCETEVQPMPKLDTVVGLDVGIKDFAVDSNDVAYENPKPQKAMLRRLTHEQRKLARQAKGSKNWQKQRKKIAKLHERIRNQRADHHHKLSRKLVDENQIIVLENLNVKGMLKNHRLAQAISDAGWAEFAHMVEYKAAWAGRTFLQVNTFFPSSQLCSRCGAQNRNIKDLAIREWTCPDCGAAHSRDGNAAQNIKMEGLRMLKTAYRP